MRFSILGDLVPGNEAISRNSHEIGIITSQLKQHFYDNDYTIVNLECPLCTSERRNIKTGPHLHADPTWATALQEAKLNIATLSNNHIMDHTAQGLQETLETLDKNGVLHVGAGLTYEQAVTPLHIHKDGISVAILNYSEHEFSSASNRSGGANPIDLIGNAAEIRLEASRNDHVIVIVHGGIECVDMPNPGLRKLLRFYADSGASLVVAHHSHNISGYEIYKGIPVYYSLGNFFFPWPGNRDSSWCYGMMLNINISKDSISCSHAIVTFASGIVDVMTKDSSEAKSINLRLESLSTLITNDTQYEQWWDEYYQKTKFAALKSIFIKSPLRRALLKFGLINMEKAINYKAFLLQYHLLNCESHRETAIRALELHMEEYRTLDKKI